MHATSPPPTPERPTGLFPFRASSREAFRIGAILRKETVGGALLVGAVVIALVWANSPWASGYEALRDAELGFAPWHLRLSLEAWAADGLLAVFFFLVGLELKREFVAGDLRRFGTAIIPIAAAVGGVAVPALVYSAIAWRDPALRGGWAIPTATDIAFAVAVLALIGSRLPSSLRIFLLTLAVVDDLIAVAIIAIFYTDTIHPVPLLAAVIAIVGYGAIAQLGRRLFAAHPAAAWLILLPIGVIAWVFMHASGIHATIAGVLLGFTVPVLHRRRDREADDGPGLAERFEHRFRPLSAGIAVPLFAFFSAGVAIGGAQGLAAALGSPLALGIMAALVIGKPVGIVVTTWLLTRVERVRLDPALRWADIVGVGLLGGIGFTVALLVDDLSFASGSLENAHAKVAIFVASLLSAVLASIVLGSRNRGYRRAEEHGDGDAVRGARE